MREGESHVGNQKRKCRSAAANNNNMRAWVRIVRQKRLLLFVSWTRSFSLVVSFFFSLSFFLSLANGWMDGWTFLLLLTAFIPDPLDDVHHGRKKETTYLLGLAAGSRHSFFPVPCAAGPTHQRTGIGILSTSLIQCFPQLYPPPTLPPSHPDSLLCLHL